MESISLGDIIQPFADLYAKSKGWPRFDHQKLISQGLIASRELPNGDLLAVEQLTFGAGKLELGAGPNKVDHYTDWRGQPATRHIGYDGGFDSCWYFEKLDDAVDQLIRWEPNLPCFQSLVGPVGWWKCYVLDRHTMKTTERRRVTND